jgi:lipid A 3-O-deacylase
VGVTGPPSLGEAVHTAWHRLTGFWEPEGWRNQVGFEPGVAVRYAEALHLDATAGDAGRVLALVPAAGAEAGNARTAAEAGVQLRAGWRVPHPWSTAADRAHGPASVYVLAGARGEAVAHDLFLDGTTFGDGPRVEREPLVGRWELGAGLRWRAVTFEFRTESRSRAYATEPGGHQYSTFALTYRYR